MAQDFNHVFLIGRITHNLDEQNFGYTNNGQARANISIAVNRSKKSGDQWVQEVSYFDITIWGKTAENLKPYLVKGKQIAVEGFLRQDRWEKDGQKFSKIAIVTTNVQLLGGKDGNSNNIQPEANIQKQPVNNSENYEQGNDEFPDDIPF